MTLLLAISIVIMLLAVGLVLLFPVKIPFMWFLLFYGNFFIGTVYQMGLAPHPSDNTHFIAMAVGLFSYLTISCFMIAILNLSRVRKFFVQSPVVALPRHLHVRIIFFLLLSIGISVLYYVSVGKNLLWMIVSGIQYIDFSTERISMYSGDEYYYPGYVNQFKNTIFPICMAYYVFNKVLIGQSINFRLIFIIPLFLLILAGTGQRAFLVHSFLAICMSVYFLFGVTKKTKRMVVLSSAAIFLVFGSMGYFYYNMDGKGVEEIIGKIFARVFLVQQEGGHIGFQVVYGMPTVYLAQWWQSFVGILPNVPGSDLAHKIHEIMYGSFRGTVPVSHVGSAYLNGGIVLVIAFFASLGMFHSLLVRRFYLGPKSIFRCLCYSFMFHYTSALLSGGPFTYVDNGLITVFILLFVVEKFSPVSNFKRSGNL